MPFPKRFPTQSPSYVSPSPPPSHSEISKEVLPRQCTICEEEIGSARGDGDGETEDAFLLPCSHVFGSTCILRWLESESPHQNCPQCRRKMVYTECGHLIRPCEVTRAPPCVAEADMPTRCLACRGLEGELRVEVDALLRRAEAEERALRVMGLCLPGVWGGMCRETVRTVGMRVEESKEGLKRDIEALCRRYEENGNREQW
ncbi:hypothetical protein DSL72_008921 [Monilinia vaccinii-corymbosi]|uniref:RING-type domain-containing protein n=1 Tax=Monilinia vaccinii-corymbosi TaxID=61207 RepID=A0A8A3PSL7_9HELO|nr:hypothetical protein DSL72_008921 [Monilinia vaccinii-corymbosi]